MSGGKSNKRGTPQGGAASPLLSVISMNRFLKHWRLTGRGGSMNARVNTPVSTAVAFAGGSCRGCSAMPRR